MGYERWHLVHLTAYAAVVLSVPHQLSDGSDLVGHPLVRAYWLGLYVLTAGAVLWWRALVPIARSLWHAPYVERVVEEAPGVWSVWIRGRHLDRLGAQAGQFFNWRFLTRGLFLAAHPWSLSARPGARRLRITVRDLGDHSAGSPGCGPAPGSWSRDRTARSPPNGGSGAGSRWSRPASGSRRCGRWPRSCARGRVRSRRT